MLCNTLYMNVFKKSLNVMQYMLYNMCYKVYIIKTRAILHRYFCYVLYICYITD